MARQPARREGVGLDRKKLEPTARSIAASTSGRIASMMRRRRRMRADMLFDRLEIVADRLLARNVGKRAEDGGEEARGLHVAGSADIGELDALHARLGIDIDEAAVDLAPGRALLKRRDGGPEGRVGKHRAVDQDGRFRVAQRMAARHGPGEEGARGPASSAPRFSRH